MASAIITTAFGNLQINSTKTGITELFFTEKEATDESISDAIIKTAVKQISEFIENCYVNKVKKINVITGKGMRSKNLDDPYQSKDLSILKHSVPEYIKNSPELMSKIINIDFDSVNSPSKGNFDIFLKTIK